MNTIEKFNSEFKLAHTLGSLLANHDKLLSEEYRFTNNSELIKNLSDNSDTFIVWFIRSYKNILPIPEIKFNNEISYIHTKHLVIKMLDYNSLDSPLSFLFHPFFLSYLGKIDIRLFVSLYCSYKNLNYCIDFTEGLIDGIEKAKQFNKYKKYIFICNNNFIPSFIPKTNEYKKSFIFTYRTIVDKKVITYENALLFANGIIEGHIDFEIYPKSSLYIEITNDRIMDKLRAMKNDFRDGYIISLLRTLDAKINLKKLNNIHNKLIVEQKILLKKINI